jgi:hypothetical protein
MPEFPCETPIMLALKLRHGDVDVVAEPRSSAFVEVTTVNGPVADARVEFHGDVLVVQVPDSIGSWLSWRPSRLRVVARIPSGSRVEGKLGAGDLRARGTFDLFHLTTGSGDVTLEHVTGDASVTSGSGDLRVERIDGSMAVNTGSGDIDVRHVGGDLTAHSASGDLTLGVVSGSVGVTTASGDVDLSVASAGTVEVKTASGDVSVGVAAGTGVWLDLATTSGDTRNDLAFQDDAAPSGSSDGPALSLRVRTISGDIRVRRTAPVAVS